ncbi:hypothetical protein Tco_1092608 [Tanacetum coccineum]|uniref:Uncharacterized protein n=1 Tax=Tanacetum coccineum TaxID=301880 RepID=A0ABQ5IAP6_9ASTR
MEIFISQVNMVAEILKKSIYRCEVCSTPVDLEKPLVKDRDADDVDIPSYSKDIPSLSFAYTDSDYAGATQDMKSTIRGCQFLGNRLISWQCKKQTVVATTTTEAEYEAIMCYASSMGERTCISKWFKRNQKHIGPMAKEVGTQDPQSGASLFDVKHNMVAYLEKSKGSEGFHQTIDFLTASHDKECPHLMPIPLCICSELPLEDISSLRILKVMEWRWGMMMGWRRDGDDRGMMAVVGGGREKKSVEASGVVETALELQKQLDEREEVAAKVNEAHDIDWKSSKLIEEEIVQQDDVIAEQAMKESSRTAGGRRKKSFARKKAKETLSEESAKKQKLEDDTKKEELKVFLNIVPEEESLDVESLATKQDVLELYKLVKERFQTASPEGYDLLIWGDLNTLIEPDEEDEIWRCQQDWNLINWKLQNFCGVHVLLMDIGLVIHMMVEKKYPLSQDTLSKMLSRRLEVDHQSDMDYELIRFARSSWDQQVVAELNTAQDITNSTNWVSTARRKVSTASTELKIAKED